MGILIKNVLAIVPKDGSDAVERHDIYIDGKTIAALDAAPAGFVAETTIDGTGRLAIPGLINAHTHTYMSMMRNAADDLSFTDWLFNTVQPIEDRLEPEDCYWASLLSQAEMIRTGTTCFNDQQMHIHQTTRAVRESGMRAVIGRGLVGDTYDRADYRLAEALEARQDVRYVGDGRRCRLRPPVLPSQPARPLQLQPGLPAHGRRRRPRARPGCPHPHRRGPGGERQHVARPPLHAR